MTIESGALEQSYVVVESSYGTLPSVTSTDAIRHLELVLDSKNNDEPNPTKRGTPDYAGPVPRRKTATWDLSSAMWEPSGTLGTPSYLSPLLQAAFGARTTPNLATTIASGASAMGATLTSGSGLAVGDVAVFTLGSGARREAARLKTVAGAAVTFDALTATPDTPGVVVSGVTYKQATNVTESLAIFLFHTAGGFKQCATGAIVNKVEFTFDGSREVGIKMSGPARNVERTGFSIPGAHTTVGDPASGLVGNLNLGAAAFLVQQSVVTLENNEGLRNTELGTAYASGHFREDRRPVGVTAQFYLEDPAVIAAAEAGTFQVYALIVGDTNGQMVGVVMPRVKWERPSIPVNQGPKTVSATGTAYATTGNDQIFAFEA